MRIVSIFTSSLTHSLTHAHSRLPQPARPSVSQSAADCAFTQSVNDHSLTHSLTRAVRPRRGIAAALCVVDSGQRRDGCAVHGRARARLRWAGVVVEIVVVVVVVAAAWDLLRLVIASLALQLRFSTQGRFINVRTTASRIRVWTLLGHSVRR